MVSTSFHKLQSFLDCFNGKKKKNLCDSGVLDILKSKHKTFCQGKLLLILGEVLFVALQRDL